MHIIVCYILELLGDDRLLLNVHDAAEQSHQDLVQYFIIVQPWNPLPLWAIQPQISDLPDAPDLLFFTAFIINDSNSRHNRFSPVFRFFCENTLQYTDAPPPGCNKIMPMLRIPTRLYQVWNNCPVKKILAAIPAAVAARAPGNVQRVFRICADIKYTLMV